MAKRLVCVAAETLEWRTFTPEPVGPQQVRIRAQFAAAKHGTEMALYKGYAMPRGLFDPEYQLFRPAPPDAARYPVGVGNMVVGAVEEVGGEVSGLAPGDRVCAYSGFADVVVTAAERCWKMPPDMDWRSAVCLDPAEFAFGAVRDGHVRIGDAVAVFGLGAIGLMVVQLARLAGAAVVVGIDPLAERRAIAERLGADLALDPTAVDAGLEIKRATAKRGVDVAIEYSGSAAAMQAALRGVAYGGTVVAGASPPPYPAGLDFGMEAHINIPTIVFSRACSQPDREHPRWDEQRIFHTCWRLLCEGRLTGEAIVTPVVAFDDLAEEYPQIAGHPDHYIKLGARI
jgi:threonine dehydrogenase-like Zn-dependent dehydrogenase